MAVNWALGLQQTNPLAMLQQGFQQGQQMRQGMETRNALASYAQNPDDAAALAPLAQYNPELFVKLHGDQQERAKASHLREIRMKAAGGDASASNELFSLDPESWGRLDTSVREDAKQRVQTLGQAALWADDPQKWDQAIDQLSAQYPELAQFKGHFSPELRARVVAEAGKIMDMIGQTEPKYMAVPQGGGLVNVRDPAAIGQWNAGVSQPVAGVPPPPPGFQLDGGGAGPQGPHTFP